MGGRPRPGPRQRADLTAAASLLALSCAVLAGCGSLASSPEKPAATDASLMAAQLQAAKQAEASYNYSDALGIYQTLYSQHPSDLDLGMGLARNLRFTGQASSEIGLVNQLAVKNGRSVPLLLELGKAYLAADQDNLAMPTLLEAKGKEPTNWEVLSTLGVAYDYQGSYADARDAYAQALIASPSNPTVLNNLALSQASSGDLDGAIATLQQAIDQPTATAQARQNLALLLALKGDPNSAERLARKDLPPEIADDNMAYFRMISAAAAKGGSPSPVSAIMPITPPSTESDEPASMAAPDSVSVAPQAIDPAGMATMATPAVGAMPAATAATMVAPPVTATAAAPAVTATMVAPAPASAATATEPTAVVPAAQPAATTTPAAVPTPTAPLPILPVPSMAPEPAAATVSPQRPPSGDTDTQDNEAVR